MVTDGQGKIGTYVIARCWYTLCMKAEFTKGAIRIYPEKPEDEVDTLGIRPLGAAILSVIRLLRDPKAQGILIDDTDEAGEPVYELVITEGEFAEASSQSEPLARHPDDVVTRLPHEGSASSPATPLSQAG